jgi:hypothetical protein
LARRAGARSLPGMAEDPPSARKDSSPEGDGTIRHSGLPPTLCSTCKHGTVVEEAYAFFGEEGDDATEFFLRQIRAIKREVCFCNHPKITAREAPTEMQHVVLNCQGYEAAPIRVQAPLRLPRTRKVKRPRSGRRGRRR